MRKLFEIAMCGAMLAAAPLADATAGPMGATAPAAVSLSAPGEKIWYRRAYRRGWCCRPGAAIAAAPAIGAGLAVAGAGYGYYGGYYPYYNYGYDYGWEAPAPVVYAPVYYYGYAPAWGWGW